MSVKCPLKFLANAMTSSKLYFNKHENQHTGQNRFLQCPNNIAISLIWRWIIQLPWLALDPGADILIDISIGEKTARYPANNTEKPDDQQHNITDL